MCALQSDTGNVIVCDVDEGTKERMERFRMRQDKNIAAIVMKIDPQKMTVGIDEELEDISIDELREELPAHQPRYVALSYVLKHDDGRVSYPFCFIFSSPQGCKPELHMMYAGSKTNAVKVMGFTKVFEVRSTDEITEDWLIEKLRFFR